jgi:hypothetical protein
MAYAMGTCWALSSLPGRSERVTVSTPSRQAAVTGLASRLRGRVRTPVLHGHFQIALIHPRNLRLDQEGAIGCADVDPGRPIEVAKPFTAAPRHQAKVPSAALEKIL